MDYARVSPSVEVYSFKERPLFIVHSTGSMYYWFIYQHGRLIFHSFHVGLCRYRDVQGGPLPVTSIELTPISGLINGKLGL